MKDKDNGNISRISDTKPAGPIQPGDYVRIRVDDLESVDMSPKSLFNVGYPNEFLVLATFDYKGVKCLTLEECCEKLKNRATGQFLCSGHHEKYFEKTEPLEHRRTSQRRFVALEAFGMSASVEFLDGQKKLLLKTPWTPDGISLSGKVAADIAEAARSIGLM